MAETWPTVVCVMCGEAYRRPITPERSRGLGKFCFECVLAISRHDEVEIARRNIYAVVQESR